MEFIDYLQDRGLSPSSRETYTRLVESYLAWLDLDPEEAAYGDLLAYIQYLQSLGRHPRYINQQLGAIQKYYSYLKHIGSATHNPAHGLRIKGTTRSLPHELLNTEQLEELYTSYPLDNLSQRRNKVILGMMIYQALRCEELEKLTIHDLEEDTLKVGATRRTDQRILELSNIQLPALEEYLDQVRPRLLGERNSQTLFLTLEGGKTLKNVLVSIIQRLKRSFPGLRNASQLQQSRIRCWLEEYDLREVQYRAGHRYISSTERYGILGLKDLKQELDKYHPLG